MQGKTAFVALLAAFCIGALVDRVYLHPPAPTPTGLSTVDDVPMPPASVSANSGTGSFNMQNCLLSATRRGMTAEQREYACNEIVN